MLRLTALCSAALLVLSLTGTAMANAAEQAAAEKARAPHITDLELKAHPRLWVPADTVANLADMMQGPYMTSAAERIVADADWLLTVEPVKQGELPNWKAAHVVGSHLRTLTSAWVLTRESKYRDGAMAYLATILDWRHISCEANLETPIENRKFFCLAYGVHSADVALMYDFFRPDMTDDERKTFNALFDRFYLWQALRAKERNPWWVNKAWSNWNGVSAGGMGMLALALYDDRPEARELLPFVDESLSHYFSSYITNGGGNHEGTGYWNYGMHYAIRYLLSYESATGKKHPAFDIPEIGQSLHFPVDFHRITFGDNDGWHTTGMYFMLAERTGQMDAAYRAAAYLTEEIERSPGPGERDRLKTTHHADTLFAAHVIPSVEKMRKLKAERAEQPVPFARVYEGLGWAAVADDTIFPRLRLAVRGGSNVVRGHGHLDVMSIKARVGEETFITDQGGGFGHVNFTGRGTDLYARGAQGKSTLIVDGLGTSKNAQTTATETVEADGLLGIRLDGSKAYLPRWRGFTGRLSLLVDSDYWLIIDSSPGHLMESRFHTYADVEAGDTWARLSQGDEQLTMTFASLSDSRLLQASGMPDKPLAKATKILRWMNVDSTRESLHVTAMNPGADKLDVEIDAVEGGFDLKVTQPSGGSRTISLTSDLNLRD